jgi:hypothetical protein
MSKHQQNPVTQKTKDKIAKGVHEARFKKLISDIESHICLKSCLDWDLYLDHNWKGGVLWIIERTSTGEEIIIANYFDWYPKHKAWCFKEICEMEGPVAICCPLRFLEKTKPIDETWRQQVKDYHKLFTNPKIPKIIEDWTKQTAHFPL